MDLLLQFSNYVPICLLIAGFANQQPSKKVEEWVGKKMPTSGRCRSACSAILAQRLFHHFLGSDFEDEKTILRTFTSDLKVVLTTRKLLLDPSLMKQMFTKMFSYLYLFHHLVKIYRKPLRTVQ